MQTLLRYVRSLRPRRLGTPVHFSLITLMLVEISLDDGQSAESKDLTTWPLKRYGSTVLPESYIHYPTRTARLVQRRLRVRLFLRVTQKMRANKNTFARTVHRVE